MPVEWASTPRPDPVFLRTLKVPGGSDGDVYLFGARYDLRGTLVGGESLGEGFFVEYFVLEKSSNDGWLVHRLLQQGSATYAETDGQDDHVSAEEIADPSGLSVRLPPAWKASEGLWPTFAYLFWSRSNGRNHYKLVEQETLGQTAEEHYQAEERSESE